MVQPSVLVAPRCQLRTHEVWSQRQQQHQQQQQHSAKQTAGAVKGHTAPHDSSRSHCLACLQIICNPPQAYVCRGLLLFPNAVTVQHKSKQGITQHMDLRMTFGAQGAAGMPQCSFCFITQSASLNFHTTHHACVSIPMVQFCRVGQPLDLLGTQTQEVDLWLVQDLALLKAGEDLAVGTQGLRRG